MQFAPNLEKQFIPLLRSVTENFSQYELKKYQIENFVYKSIDSGQIICGNSSIYEIKDEFLSNFEYFVPCKLDDKLNAPFQLNMKLMFDKNRYFKALDINMIVDAKMIERR